MPPTLELQLRPGSDVYESNDARWQNQVAGLLTDLRRNGGEVRKEITPVPGQKGGVETLILALGSSGAITAAITIFKAWLARSADRALEIEGAVDGRKVKLKITGTNIDEKTLRTALGVASG